MAQITLFDYNDSGIHINIIARFDGDDLVIDGYDIGSRVEELTGDSDYEYCQTITKDGVLKLGKELGCDPKDKEILLKALSERFHGNHCYSEICEFLAKRKIDSVGSSW